MNQQVKRIVRRASAAFGALGLGATITVVSLLAPTAQVVHAFPQGGQVQTRSVEMSSSTPGATAVNYHVTFTPATTATIKGIVLDFCTGSPIIGDTTCGAPTGFDVGGATPAVSTTSGSNGVVNGLPGTWTAAGINTISGGAMRTLTLDNSSGSSLSSSSSYDFALTNVTNPTTIGSNSTGTFYARIITYTADGVGSDFANYSPGSEGSTTAEDYGGFALSTANVINITAKVQETLAFCVVNVDLGPTGNQCGDSVAVNASHVPNLTIGHGSPVQIIDNTAVDRATAYMQMSTNASTGVSVRMHAGNTCSTAGLSTNGGGTCNIPGVDNNASNAQPINAGTATFGLFVGNGYTTTGVSSSTGTFTATGKYNDGTHTDEVTPSLYYGMDNTASTGVTGTYGSLLGSTTGPCNTLNSHLVFAATAGLTTPAGIYKASESLIATGTF